MKVYQRYLAKEIYLSVLFVMVAFLALFAFFDLMAEIDDIGRGGYKIHHALLYVLLTLPGRVYELFPIAVLIGTLYALTLLARHSEITVLRASGMATGSLLGTLGQIGIAFVVLTFLFGEVVLPPSERAAQQLRLSATSSVVAQEFRSGLWVRDEKVFLNVKTVLPDTTLRGIRMYEFDERWVLRSISEAEEGRFVRPDKWRLTEVVQTSFLGDRTAVTRLPERLWKSTLSPEVLSVLLVAPERMSLSNLNTYIHHLSENQQRTERYEIAVWKKLIYPLASLVMMALAVPFAYMHDRMGAVSLKVFAGIMIGIGFHALNGLFSNLGVINSWPPVVAALTPSLAFLATAAMMLWWVERR